MPDEHGKWTLEEYFQHFPDTKHAMRPLVDENERLRAALTEIAEWSEKLSSQGGYSEAESRRLTAYARAALEVKSRD